MEGCRGHTPTHTKARTRRAEDVPAIPYLSTGVCVRVTFKSSDPVGRLHGVLSVCN